MGDISDMNDIDKGIDSHNLKKPMTKFRDLLTIIMKSSTQITSVSDCDEHGDMSFVINLKDLGLTSDNFIKYSKEFFSNYVVDMVGELLIRENLHLFADKLMRLKTNYYMNAVGKSIHKRFGMKIEKGIMTFYFHISLVQEILTEDFKLQ